MIYSWLVAFILIGGSLTFLYPCLAAAVAALAGVQKRILAREQIRLDILVPAYSESDTITRTLDSLIDAWKSLLEVEPSAIVKITVGLDGSPEATRQTVLSYAQSAQSAFPVHVLDRLENKGKWQTLQDLVATSTLDWCALVDAGTLWPKNFLITIASHLREGRYLGIAPGYHQDNAGLAEKLVWGLERLLKRIENYAGGPCSLHGATTIFDRIALQAALKEVSYRNWFNDDVVIALRFEKAGASVYLGSALSVSDCGVRESSGEHRRRARILVGNIEWITEIFPKVMTTAPLAGLVAMRRVARTFWAYHLVLAAMAFCFALSGALWALALTFLGFTGLLVNKRLRDAFIVSLSGPRFMTRKGRVVSWV